MTSNESLDERTAELMSRMGQSVSRRGILARMGAWAFKVAGLSLAPVLLPVNRAFAQFSCAGDWQTCNMHGNWCKACCGDSNARYASCPACTTQSPDHWTGCCSSDGCGGSPVLIRYFDCCGTNPGYSDAEAAACKGDPCGLDTDPATSCPDRWPQYCSTGVTFRCTIVVNTGSSCSPIQSRCV